MDAIFMNQKNSKTSDFTDKIDLRRKDKYVALSNLSIYYSWKNIKKSLTAITNLRYQLQHGMRNLNYLTDHILYQTVKII